ncbi:arsenate reductase/protein-tyrosine-phosphatase family protein [Haliea sp.]
MLDADMVSALTIARSLRARHYIVDVASARKAPLAAYSNAINAHFQYPDPLLGEAAFLEWLQQHLQNARYDLVIPVTERSLVPLTRHRHQFDHTRLAMADEESLRLVLDKAATFKLAERLGVSTPQSLHISSIGELQALLPQLRFPVVVKPSHSVSGGAAGYSKRNVSYADNEAELNQQCGACLQHSPVILQSYFRGLGAGVELIAQQGEILYAFQHLRLHEIPLTGGGSSFRTSTELEPALLDAASRLIREILWNGVAMVEFKWDPATNEYCLMEINGRFWGSLPLAVAAGADFPAMQAELSLTGGLGDYPPYRRGVYCRNLSSDVMWHEMVLRSHSDQITQVPSPGKVLRDLSKVLSPRHHFDTQCLSDPLPGLIEIKRLIASYGSRLFAVLAERWFTLSQRLLWRNGTVRERLRASKTVLFICYGNINRSALAQALMTARLPSCRALEVRSAGFHLQEQRPADPRMVQVAAQHAVDMTHSRSRCVNTDLLADSDIIFVMEKGHYDRLVAMDPAVASRTFLLGAGPAGSALPCAEIGDPYNKSETVYRTCFDDIQRAVTYLVRELPVHHAGY